VAEIKRCRSGGGERRVARLVGVVRVLWALRVLRVVAVVASAPLYQVHCAFLI
jgi:hypothetical protein